MLRFLFNNHSNQSHKEKTKHKLSHPVYLSGRIIEGDKSRLRSVIIVFLKSTMGSDLQRCTCRLKEKPIGWENSTIPRTHGIVDQNLRLRYKSIPQKNTYASWEINDGLRSKRYPFINKDGGIINRKTWLQAHQNCIPNSIFFNYRLHLLNIEQSIDLLTHMDATQFATVFSHGERKQGRLTTRITNPKRFLSS